MFTEVEFQNFRGFADLKLKGLKRVNLVVGRNNAGKTSFLEGVVLLANHTSIQSLPTLLRPSAGKSIQRFYRWLIRDQSNNATATLASSGSRVVVLKKAKDRTETSGPFPQVWHHGPYRGYANNDAALLPYSVVSVLPRSPEQLVKLFSAAVSKRGGEEQMDALFHELDERIRKVRIIPNDDGLHVMLDFNLSELVPLSQVGQGVHRLLTIFSELIAGDAKVCIIDEVENGIHHTMLKQVWSGIATAAANLDVQVFATTHSHECIEAAHEAFTARDNYDFSVVQLFRLDEGVQGRVLDRKHIEAALAGEIDLR
jgi:AAA15 family ATPase/GTPase